MTQIPKCCTNESKFNVNVSLLNFGFGHSSALIHFTMPQGVSEVAAVCVGLIGLIGAAATTGMPMWKVTAFIGANIIVMETRWEGLWMNCYRQANIRMQCKVYDSLLFLPPELQAARGLMCCSLALSGLGLLVAMAGMRCISCVQGNDRAKTIILMVAGVMQFLACICVFIPVSWTGHVIIRDFYNPLLIDAQRRELGESLYIGWVTGAFLFASAMLFVCRRFPSDKGSFEVYHPANFLGYKTTPSKPTLMRYHPISSVSSDRSTTYQPSLLNNGAAGPQLAMPLENVPHLMTTDGALINPPVVYNRSLPENASLLYQGGMARHSSMRSSNHAGSIYTPGNSLYISQNTTPCSLSYIGNPTASYQSSFHPVPHTPIFIGYKESRIQPVSHSGSSAGVYI
ncbi:claudin-8-like [Trachinotus anak]|uniref:claudin-8-like n=1 Tax=Trachinotus anak TaxID=443729 RepID=UPI0039F23F46